MLKVKPTGQRGRTATTIVLSNTHPFNGPLFGTTQVSQYQKGETNLDFTEARDSEWQWHQLSHMQVCTSLHTDNHASTPPLSFLQAGCPFCHPANSINALKAETSGGRIVLPSSGWNLVVIFRAALGCCAVLPGLLVRWCWSAVPPGSGSTSSAARTAKESLCRLSCQADQPTSAATYDVETSCSPYVSTTSHG